MKKLIIDYGFLFNRLAILDNDILTDLYLENKYSKSIVGNIYLARVTKIIKPISAVFLDLGFSKAYMQYIDKSVKTGDEILVQVLKDPILDKKAFVTTDISLSKKYIVLLPTSNEIKISKKIYNNEVKDRFYQLLEDFEYGFVVRTEASNASDDEIINEVTELISIYKEIEKKKNRILKNRLVYEDYTFDSIIEKEYISDVDEIISNKKINISFDNFKYHKGINNVFDEYRINEKIDVALHRKIVLNQGIFITIDETEAFTAIDVNSGKYIGNNKTEETFLQVNILAAKEIARIIKLRNISGIIIIDFINMKDEKNIKHLINVLNKYFRKDGARPKIHGITSLGLMEITRRKNRKSLLNEIYTNCDYCLDGRVLSKDIVASKMIDEVILLAYHTGRDYFSVEVSDAYFNYLNHKKYLNILYVEKGITINLIKSDVKDYQIKRVYE